MKYFSVSFFGTLTKSTYASLRVFNTINVELTKIQMKMTLKEIIDTYFHNEMRNFSNKNEISLDLTLGEFHEMCYLQSPQYKKSLLTWLNKKGEYFSNLLKEGSENFLRYYINSKGKGKKE